MQVHLLNMHKTLNLYDESNTYNTCNQIIQRRQTAIHAQWEGLVFLEDTCHSL